MFVECARGGPEVSDATGVASGRAPWCRAGDLGHVHSVLVVDDEPSVQALVGEVLSLEGYAVVASPNGAAALEQAGAEPPCLALVDLRMPVMDGATFVRECRQDSGLHDLPVIILSASQREAEAARLDVLAVIPKPFDIQHLLDWVAAALDEAPAPVQPPVAA